MTKYEKGKIVTGCVTGITDYGIFVNLDEYYSGLIHISEISNKFVRDINDYVNIGETIKVKIVEKDDKNFHLKLSIKDINYRNSKKPRIKIEETKSGFSGLKKHLDGWIEDKLNETDSKS